MHNPGEGLHCDKTLSWRFSYGDLGSFTEEHMQLDSQTDLCLLCSYVQKTGM